MTLDLTPQFRLHIEQGVNFEHGFQWLAGGIFMAPIEYIETGYPTVLEVTSHGLNTLSSHPVIISGVEGCEALNSSDTDIALCTRIDDDHFSVPQSSVNKTWEEGSGEITYHIPTDITDYTCRCVIRKNWFSSTVIHELTTENDGIVLTVADGGIQLLIPKVATAAFNFTYGVYDVDMIAPSGYESRVFKGPVTLHREISTSAKFMTPKKPV
ncbi:MAG: hypothetical protein JRE23_15505 [Deltaproteobacteria bacterium]|nr:hypothetical protein [Deltaproteobacteria bacterium]